MQTLKVVQNKCLRGLASGYKRTWHAEVTALRGAANAVDYSIYRNKILLVHR
jgi:tRNA(Arg) A34 adenosine deaminase TadA